MRRAQVIGLLAGTTWASLMVPVTLQSQTYIVTDLGRGTANGINNSGQAVGQTDNEEAFVWDAGTRTILPPLVGGSQAEALAINDSGQIVGWSETAYGFAQDHGVLWENGTARDLGTMSGGHYSWASAINNGAVIVGYSEIRDQFGNNPRDRACGSDNGSAWVSLGTLPGASSYASHAWAINENGVIGGESRDANFQELPCLWPDGTASSIQALTLPAGYQMAGWVSGLNDSNDAVGAAQSSSYGTRAVLWPYGQSPVNLGTLPGGGESFASDINNVGQVVGSSGYDYRACMWRDGQIYDLNVLIAANSGWVLKFANAINDAGQIVGSGDLNGERHAFLLSPVKLVDAQGFQPSLDQNGAPYLAVPITNRVDASFERVGSLTDGASLVVVQVGMPGMELAGWKVSLVDPDNPTYGAAELGSLWNGDELNLPPLPATLSDPGTITATLGAGETTVLYRAAASWAFGKGSKDHEIEIRVLDQGDNVMAVLPFALRKPPLVLVHGWTGNPRNWDGFASLLTNYGYEFDTYRADYEACNTCGMDSVFHAVPEEITTALEDFRRNLLTAATRVDVVAHSYGGIVARWYMTPSSQLPDGQDRTVGANPAPLFKTTTIVGTRSPDFEFVRSDNFGIGDIRRFITLGVPHAGTSAGWKAIQLLNRWVSGKAYRNRELRNDTMSIERTLSTQDREFRAIGLDEPGTPTEVGMSVIDTAAFGTHPTTGVCGLCPATSLAISSLAPIPVRYLPIEGTIGYSNNSFAFNALVWIVQRYKLHGAPPADLLPDVSDGFIPALSVRNRTARRDQYNLIGVHHAALTSTLQLTNILEEALGPGEEVFLNP